MKTILVFIRVLKKNSGEKITQSLRFLIISQKQI